MPKGLFILGINKFLKFEYIIIVVFFLFVTYLCESFFHFYVAYFTVLYWERTVIRVSCLVLIILY